MTVPDAPVDTRYSIYRRGGQTLCKPCDDARDLAHDPAGYALWFTAAAAWQRGLTHCEDCGRAVVPPPETPNG
jgi:hypothetical protein